MGKFSIKKVTKSVSKAATSVAKPIATVATPIAAVAKPIASVAPAITQIAKTVPVAELAKIVPAAAIVKAVSSAADTVAAVPNLIEQKLKAELDALTKRIKSLTDELNLEKLNNKLSIDTINQKMSEIQRLLDERDSLENTLNALREKEAQVSEDYADLIYKTYAPMNARDKQNFEDSVYENRIYKTIDEGFSLKPKSWKKKPKRKANDPLLTDIEGGTKVINKYGAKVIARQKVATDSLLNTLDYNQALNEVLEATALTGLPYKYTITSNQNQLISTQIEKNTDIYRTDIRKTEYKTYKIQWLEFINKILFYVYYLIAFFCIVKLALNYQAIPIKLLIGACIFIYPLAIGKIEQILIFIYTFLKSFLLGDSIDKNSDEYRK